MRFGKANVRMAPALALLLGCARGLVDPFDANADETPYPSDDADGAEAETGLGEREAVGDGTEARVSGDAADAVDGPADLPADLPHERGFDAASGNACEDPGECATGFCVDGVCCENACRGTCMACNVADNEGKCVNSRWGIEDPNATLPCTAPLACNGFGQCRKSDGQSCTAGAECVSPYCAAGVCCNQSCSGLCKSCGATGKDACTNLPAGSTTLCAAPAQCDGNGACRKTNGTSCGGASDCQSGFCTDGVCCNEVCTTPCYACNLTGKVGTCSPIPIPQPDNNPAGACVAPKGCDGAGKCGKPAGTTCYGGSDCDSGLCCAPPGAALACRTASLGCACAGASDCRTDAPVCGQKPSEASKTCRTSSAGMVCYGNTDCSGTAPVCCPPVGGGDRTCKSAWTGCVCWGDSDCGGTAPICCAPSSGGDKTCHAAACT